MAQAPKEQRLLWIGGNWKSNGTQKSINDLIDKLLKVDVKGVDVIVAPTYIHLSLVSSKLKNMQISAQNVSLTGEGAYTGEIAAEQLLDLDIKWTIIGHSERRALYHETDEIIGGKVKRALEKGLKVVACLGETLAERKANKVKEVCYRQLKAIVDNVPKNSWHNIVIAYEPVWAIGTGEVCPCDKAQDVCALLRDYLNEHVNKEVAQTTRIVYGGSVKPDNSDELIKQSDIDGFLVGGASLKADQFSAIISSAQHVKK